MPHKYQLAICIPARNEEFLTETIDDILSHTGEETHLFIGLDGQWSVKPIVQHPRVTVLYVPESIGQRALTKQLARLAKDAKYFAKTDAHVSVSDNFGIEMIKAMEKAGDDVTMAPIMRNLHAFNWKCEDGHIRYQGPSGPCQEKGCGKKTTKDICWIAKGNPQSTAFCYDATPHFQYMHEMKRRDSYKKQQEECGLTETMSLQGSFFMMTMKKYWELDVDDETFGSWGSQGALVATKTWLSGGKVLINHKAYYAHMFRTQGGDFSFPYPQSGHGVERAKRMTRDLFFGNNWPLQKRPLSWLVERFWPVPGWTEEDLKRIKEEGERFMNKKPLTKGIIYYSDNAIDPRILAVCQDKLKSIGLPIVSCTLKPVDMGKNFVLPLERGNLTLFKQMLKAIEESDADVLYLCEHDVLYHTSHFDFVPKDRTKIYYNQNVWQTRTTDGFSVKYTQKSVSQVCAYRDVLLKHYRERVRRVEAEGWNRKMGYEPGAVNRAERIDDLKSDIWESPDPNVDLKHGKNLTEMRWSTSDFRHDRYCRNWQESTTPEWAKDIVEKFK